MRVIVGRRSANPVSICMRRGRTAVRPYLFRLAQGVVVYSILRVWRGVPNGVWLVRPSWAPSRPYPEVSVNHTSRASSGVQSGPTDG